MKAENLKIEEISDDKEGICRIVHDRENHTEVKRKK